MKKTNKKGFTIVELLAVVVIIAILSVIAIATVFNVTRKAREKQYETNRENMGTATRMFGEDAKNGLSNINNALVYKDDNGKVWKIGCTTEGLSKTCCVDMNLLKRMGYLKVTEEDMCGDNLPCINFSANLTFTGNGTIVDFKEDGESCEVIKYKLLYHSVEKINAGEEETVEDYC